MTWQRSNELLTILIKPGIIQVAVRVKQARLHIRKYPLHQGCPRPQSTV